MTPIELTADYLPIEMTQLSCCYLPAKDSVAGKRVLDISCGQGAGVRLLLEWGAAEVVGLDSSEAHIVDARNFFSDHKNVQFICADVGTFLAQSDEHYDVIISTGTLVNVSDLDAFMQVLAQRKIAGAMVIISCLNTYFHYGRGASVNGSEQTRFSYYDLRTITERHLGRAEWFLGTPSAGAAAVSVSYIQTGGGVGKTAGCVVPGFGSDHDGLKPSTAVFYIGVWTLDNLQDAYQAVFPASSHYRLPRLTKVSDDVAAGRVRRVAFVIDQHEWAFDNIVKNMQPYLEGRYHVAFYYITDYATPTELLHDVFIENDYDNVHFMWREFLFHVFSNARIMRSLLNKTGSSVEELAARISAPVLTTSVYDHLFLRAQDVVERQEHFKLVDAYATSSHHLQKAYHTAYDHKPAVEISDGVNLSLFAPARAQQLARKPEADAVFKVGWVGNSAWGNRNASMVEDAKGLHTILAPAVEQLVLDGYRVALDLADRNIRHRSRAEMVAYYGQIDLLVCCSAAEGTPNPILEAMASSVPFVSTDVGIVAEAAGPLQSKFILPTRSVQGLYSLIKEMLDNPDMRQAVAAENTAWIEDWHWAGKTENWLQLFARAEEIHTASGQRLRKATLTARIARWDFEARLDAKQKQLTQIQGQEARMSLEVEAQRDELAKISQNQRAQEQALSAAKDQAERDRAEIKRLRAAVPITKQRILRAIKRRIRSIVG